MTNVFMKKLGTGLLLTTLVVTAACTKKRDAKMPDEEAEGTFAIAELDMGGKPDSSFTFKTGSDTLSLSLTESTRATNEKGLAFVDSDSAQVPERLRYMFTNLEVSGQANQTFKIAFTVDNKALTALRVVNDPQELGRLESQLALSKEEINLQKKIQSTRDAAQTQKLLKQLTAAQKNRQGPLYVPLFKFEVKAYGTLERIKNPLGESTSTLHLKPSEWARATHIQISTRTDDRILVSNDPAAKEEMDRIFVADRVNNKITTAAQLNEQLAIGLNLKPETRILTLLDAGSMRVFEITQSNKANLTEAQKEILRTKSDNGEISACSAEIVKNLPAEDRDNCILIQRFNIPVNYVRAEMPVIDYNGARTNTVQFKEASAAENTGLVRIAKNVMPEEVQPTGTLDPRKTLRIVDIKNKEFFFRRTLEDVSAMGKMSGGMAGNVQLVKFVLEENRLVVQKTLGAIDFKKTTNMENEEVLSLPVTYVKRQLKDAAGNPLSVPKYVPATKEDAEYATLDWTNNTIPVLDSPLAFYAEASCFDKINNQQVVDTDMRLSEGVLSFSYLYSVTMAPSEQCLSFFSPAGDYDIAGGYSTQFVQQVRERLSFKANDGSTDKNFAPTTPFTAQNALNYGVFTKGILLPSENGSYGREGSQINYPAVHDFRDGKKFLYTVGGLPDNDPKRRELLKRVATEVIADWNATLRKAFTGTPLQREDDYLQVQFAGENGVVAHLGDLDKNLIWFVDRAMDNGLLGVSQVGLNPRSGMMAADSLIIYNGNNAGELEAFRRYYKILVDFKKGLKAYQDAELAKGPQNKTTEQNASAEAEKAVVAQGAGAPAAEKLFSQLKAVRNVKALSNARPQTPLRLKTSAWIKSSTLDKSQLTAIPKKFGPSKTADGYIDRLFHKALELNVASDRTALESLTAKEVLATYGNKMSLQQRSLLQQKAALMDLHSRLDRFFRANPGCALRSGEFIGDAVYSKYLEMPEDEALALSTKATLAHELGHSLGLTHNFVGSYDKANFNFEGESSKRNYSSIMDYINDSMQVYDGPGPYDVYALRAAYTGLLEVRPEARNQAALAKTGFKGPLINNRFIDIKDIKNTFAKSGWANFTGRNGVKDLVQPFKYCTDKDVGYEPVCQRFDYGTTPLEIVQNEIKEYQDRYVVTHFAGDRLSFDWGNKASTISQAFSTMYKVRQFLDEGIYRLVVGLDENASESEYVTATYAAYRFLLNVILTPDTDKDIMDYSRFEKVTYEALQKDGSIKPATGFIEARAQNDATLSPERYYSLGTEIDKLLAMEILTLKGIGLPKYEEINLNMSYVDFEKIFGMLEDSGLSPITRTLSQILMNDLQGRVFLNNGEATSTQKVTTSTTLMSYAGINAVLGLEASTLDEQSNYANLFKVGSTLGNRAPTDRPVLSPLGVTKTSQAKMSYWAADNAKVANVILERGTEIKFFIDLSEQMSASATKLVSAQSALVIATAAKDQAAIGANTRKIVQAKKEMLKVMTAANKTGLLATPEQITAEPSFALDKQVETIESMSLGLLNLIAQADRDMTKEEEEKFGTEVQKFISWLNEIGLTLPAVASAQKAILNGLNLTLEQIKKTTNGAEPESTPQGKLLAITSRVAKNMFSAYSQNETDYGLILRNINFLNQLTLMTNPEYNR